MKKHYKLPDRTVVCRPFQPGGDDDGKHYVWQLSERERILQDGLAKKGHRQ